MSWQLVEPVLNDRVRGLCVRPYAGHPRGCPNHNKRDTCPPNAPQLHEWSGSTDMLYVIWNRFPFGEHVQRMRGRHPGWSERQVACCLYWQGTARKALRAEVAKFFSVHPRAVISMSPEAMGIDVTATMASVGIALEWPPREWAFQVAIAAKVKEEGDL